MSSARETISRSMYDAGSMELIIPDALPALIGAVVASAMTDAEAPAVFKSV